MCVCVWIAYLDILLSATVSGEGNWRAESGEKVSYFSLYAF